MLATEVRSGDAPKPPFSTKSIEKSKKSGNQPLNRQKQKSLFPSLYYVQHNSDEVQMYSFYGHGSHPGGKSVLLMGRHR